jgi:cytochrome c-type biogenesis protein CcmH/NrfF
MRSALLLFAVLLCAAPAAADAPPPDETWAYDLAHELMSPYCPGRALAECPSPQADQLRLWIIAQARAGKSRAEVQAELAANFGDQIRQAPRAEGIGLIAYAVPAAFVVVGAALLAVFLRRSGSRA